MFATSSIDSNSSFFCQLAGKWKSKQDMVALGKMAELASKIFKNLQDIISVEIRVGFPAYSSG